MNAKKESKLNMFRAVAKHSNDNPAIIATVPAFQNAITALNTTISSILSTAQLEAQVISGMAVNKSQRKEALARQAADIAAAVFAYAASANDVVLKEQANIPYSSLIREKDEMLSPVCSNIHNIANTNIASLAPFGITPAVLTAFMNAITDYSSAVPTPRNAVSQRKAYAAELRKLIKDADKILKEQTDKLIGSFKTTHPEFVTAYKSNRVIVDPGSAGTQIKGKIINAADNKGIKDAVVEIVGLSLVDNTSPTGLFTLKPGAAGTFSIKITKAGFQEKTVTGIIVQIGKPTDVGTIALTA